MRTLIDDHKNKAPTATCFLGMALALISCTSHEHRGSDVVAVSETVPKFTAADIGPFETGGTNNDAGPKVSFASPLDEETDHPVEYESYDDTAISEGGPTRPTRALAFDLKEIERHSELFIERCLMLFNRLIDVHDQEESSEGLQALVEESLESYANLLLSLQSLQIHLGEETSKRESQMNGDSLRFAYEFVTGLNQELLGRTSRDQPDTSLELTQLLFQKLTRLAQQKIAGKTIPDGRYIAYSLLDALRDMTADVQTVSRSVEKVIGH